jgi:hypothetical protein
MKYGLAWIGLILALVGCVQGQSMGAPPQPGALQLNGQLTRKGPDLGGWWAVTQKDGSVWRIEAADAAQASLIERSQNQSVQAEGVAAGTFLNAPVLKLTRFKVL